VDPTADLDAVVKIKIPTLLGEYLMESQRHEVGLVFAVDNGGSPVSGELITHSNENIAK
jgi:hypothetical protein